DAPTLTMYPPQPLFDPLTPMPSYEPTFVPPVSASLKPMPADFAANGSAGGSITATVAPSASAVEYDAADPAVLLGAVGEGEAPPGYAEAFRGGSTTLPRGDVKKAVVDMGEKADGRIATPGSDGAPGGRLSTDGWGRASMDQRRFSGVPSPVVRDGGGARDSVDLESANGTGSGSGLVPPPRRHA
ncbi:hypothetical protein HK101_004074, partial [Irineochytrium annulatum]